MTSEKAYAVEARINKHVGEGWTIPFESVKSALEGRTSTTLADDADLQVDVDIGTYALELDIVYTGGAGVAEGDLKLEFTGPANTNFQMQGFVRLASDAGVIHQNTMTAFSTPVTIWTNGFANLFGMSLSGGATFTAAGTLKFRWACNVNTGTQTRVLDGSRLMARRVG